MSYKADINTSAKQFFYSDAAEDNTSDGRTFELPKKEPQAALDSAAAQSPSIGNKSQVKEGQGGEYAGAILLKDSVDFDGTQTILTSSAAVTVTAASDVSFKTQAVDNTGSGIALKIDGETGFHATIDDMTITGDGGTALEVTGSCDDIFVKTTHVMLNDNNTVGVRMEATSPSPIDLNYDSIQLNGNGATAIEWNQANLTDVGTVKISTIGQAGTSGKAVHLLSTNLGNLTLNSQIINADILIEGGGFVSNAHVINMPVLVGSGAIATFTSIGVQFGSLTIEAGATVFIECGNCPGSLTIDPAAIVNGTIDGVPYGTSEEQTILVASDLTMQVPTGTDAPLQITFGGAQNSTGGEVSLAADGSLTANIKKNFLISIVLQYGRNNAGMASWLFFRVLVDGVAAPDPVFAKLDNSNAAFPVQFRGRVALNAGEVFTIEMIRDSQGFDDGELITETPTLVDWDQSPSARLTVGI